MPYSEDVPCPATISTSAVSIVSAPPAGIASRVDGEVEQLLAAEAHLDELAKDPREIPVLRWSSLDWYW